MIGQPKVVVIEIGNILRPRIAEALVVGSGLLTDVVLQISEMYPRIAEGCDYLFGIVGAGVPDYPEFPLAKSLPPNAFNRQREDVAAIVSRCDNRDEWSGFTSSH